MAESPSVTSETHGTRNDIDEDTPVNRVKGPNMFKRVKEEVSAIVEAIHSKKEKKKEKEKEEKEKEKEDTSPPHKNHRHHKETHGMSDDIDETTSVDEVKGPNVFHRMKEEVEAIVEAIHPKKDSDGQK